MTKFLEKSFSSRVPSDDYREGWEAIFGNKEVETQPELPEESEFGINECPPAPKAHFYGPQEDGTYTMESHPGRTTFYVDRNQTNGYRPCVYRASSIDHIGEELDLRTILVYCSSERFRAWLEDRLSKS
jgi:hypothetical protein